MGWNLISWVWHFFILGKLSRENYVLKIAGNQIENKGFQSKNTNSAIQTMFKHCRINWKIWGRLKFSHPHFPPHIIIIVPQSITYSWKHARNKRNLDSSLRFFKLKLKCFFFASAWCVLVFPSTQFLYGKLLIFGWIVGFFRAVTGLKWGILDDNGFYLKNSIFVLNHPRLRYLIMLPLLI
jgi:hypothetical protein